MNENETFQQKLQSILEKVREYNAKTVKTTGGGCMDGGAEKTRLLKAVAQKLHQQSPDEPVKDHLHRAKYIIREARTMPGDAEANALRLASKVTSPHSFYETDTLIF